MTSRFGRTIRRSRMRCRKCPSGSGKWGSPRRRTAAVPFLAVLAAVPFLRVDVVVRRARLQDIEERVALVFDPLLQQGDQVLDVVGISAPDPGRAGGQGEPNWIHRVVDVR